MTAPQSTRVPRGLDDPPLFLLWRADQAVTVAVVTFIGALFHHLLIGFAAGIVCAFFTHRLQARFGAGAGIAALYWYLGYAAFRRVIPSSLRKLIG